MAANKALDEEFRAKKVLLRPLEMGSFSLWPLELQQAWQGNLFAPAQAPVGPDQYDFNSLKTSYLAMKEILKDNRCPIPGRRLMQAFPATKLGLYTYAKGTESSPDGRLARLLPEDSAERKFAVLDSILSYHTGEVRAWGGTWELQQGALDPPSGAKAGAWSELLALELRTNPLGVTDHVPTTYTEKEVLDQIAGGQRPDLQKILHLLRSG